MISNSEYYKMALGWNKSHSILPTWLPIVSPLEYIKRFSATQNGIKSLYTSRIDAIYKGYKGEVKHTQI